MYNIYNNSNELDILKEKVLKLEEELNKKEMIIEMQREERVKLTQKVDELENIFTSLISMNKFLYDLILILTINYPNYSYITFI